MDNGSYVMYPFNNRLQPEYIPFPGGETIDMSNICGRDGNGTLLHGFVL